MSHGPLTRRKFVVAMGVAAALHPWSARSQTRDVRRVGLLVPTPYDPNHPQVVAFMQRLRDLGHVEGRNVVFEARGGLAPELPRLAAELVALNPDILVAWAPPATAALRQTTKTTPIVIAAGGDPVQAGFVASFARPGGNTTGVAATAPDLYGKHLELLREALPRLSLVAVLWDSTEHAIASARDVLVRASTSMHLGLEWVDAGDLDAAFDRIVRKRAGAVLVTAQTRNYNRPREIAELALRHRLPSIFGEPVGVRAGGLMAYTTDWVELSRTAAGYVDRILRGANPADLPISFATRFNFLVNLKTAKALGLTLPPALVLRAQEVIE